MKCEACPRLLATALSIGYCEQATIAKRAYAELRPSLDVAEEMSGLTRAELEALLDQRKLTYGGIPEGGHAGRLKINN